MRYAGIGSTNTPASICNRMTFLASELDNQDHILHSGGAPGADLAFEAGVVCNSNKRIFLPEKGWNESDSQLFLEGIDSKLVQEAYNVVDLYHPAPLNLSPMGRKLMARNSFQVLGMDLESPVDMVICWTRNGKMVGGTSQALRIALDYKIPIYNLANMSDTIEIFTKVLNVIEDNPLGL